MKQTQLIELQKKLGIAPNKRLGQNFLIDDNFAEWIVRKAGIAPGENVLEVGPGFGALTSLLVGSGANVAAIEFDRKIAQWLAKEYASTPLRLIEADACRTDVASIFGPGAPFRVVSNLPYSSGSVFIANMLLLKTPPRDMTVMLQKEVARRFSATVGSGDYGSFSVRLQAMYESEILRIIPPDVFFPPPEIDSALLRLTLKENRPSPALFKTLTTLVKASFAHRRKKMFKQAASVFGAEGISDAMDHAEADRDIRAEKVSPEQFMRMAEFLSGRS